MADERGQPKAQHFSDPGEGIHEAEVVEILVEVGDSVADGDTIMVVETDKATSEIASDLAGEVRSVEVEVGQIIEVGDLLIRFGDIDENEPADAQPENDADPASSADGSNGGAPDDGDVPEAETQPGPDGDRDETPERSGQTGRVAASPATRRLARELGVELDEVEPTGQHGRTTSSDVRRAAADPEEEAEATNQEPQTSRRSAGDPADREGAAARDASRETTREEPLRGVRRAIAEQMEASWTPIPRVTHHDSVDITELERFRRRHAERIADSGGQLGLLVLAMKATAAALKQFPRFNASLDDDVVLIKESIHLGIAVDTEDGLLVPVVRNVDTKSIEALATELPVLLDRTRDRGLDRSEMQGATFTITNVGPLGGTSFTPMVNHPQVAILGMAKARLELRVRGDIDDPPEDLSPEPRMVLPLSLSFDHRVNDGADAARFTNTIIELLADPERMVLTL